MILRTPGHTPFARLFASLLRVPEKNVNPAERLYRSTQLVENRGPISFNDLAGELEVSRATLKRDLDTLRSRFNAPLEFDQLCRRLSLRQAGRGTALRTAGAVVLGRRDPGAVTMHQMLVSLDAGGLLGPHIKPLMERLSKALGADAGNAQEVLKRVKLLPSQQRRVKLKWFELIGAALMKRNRLKIDYFTRSRNERSEREVSPQRLVNYRGNWYLDAFCHKSEGVRMFSLDSIENAVLWMSRRRRCR